MFDNQPSEQEIMKQRRSFQNRGMAYLVNRLRLLASQRLVVVSVLVAGIIAVGDADQEHFDAELLLM